jgi:hypothetical protein
MVDGARPAAADWVLTVHRPTAAADHHERCSHVHGRVPPRLHMLRPTSAALAVRRNVRVIDGTGAAARAHQTLVIRDGVISDVGDAARIVALTGSHAARLHLHAPLPEGRRTGSRPAQRIGDVRNVELVFRHGVGYDPERLRASVRGSVGLF